MNCDEVKANLNAYIDEETSSAKALQISQHLESCTACSESHNELNNLSHMIKSSHAHDSAPIYLKKQISNKLKEADKPPFFWSAFQPKITYAIPSLALGLMIGLTAGILPQYTNQENGNELLQSLASAHIHSLMSDHITDVASSDSHTVKPWFHGRVDFSPQVRDLAKQGYPLIGGRLEYLSRSSAVALVYQRRKHVINLFIQPFNGQNIKLDSSGYNGYHIVHWNDNGLSYWAISDLNLAELKKFKQLHNQYK